MIKPLPGAFVYIRNQSSGYEQTFFFDAEMILGLLHSGTIVHARASGDLARPTFVLSSEAKARARAQNRHYDHSDYFRSLFPGKYLQAQFTGRNKKGDRYTQFTASLLAE